MKKLVLDIVKRVVTAAVVGKLVEFVTKKIKNRK